jgi:5-methylthioadenosine/S-adenosylhomocysteine deaminase
MKLIAQGQKAEPDRGWRCHGTSLAKPVERGVTDRRFGYLLKSIYREEINPLTLRFILIILGQGYAKAAAYAAPLHRLRRLGLCLVLSLLLGLWFGGTRPTTNSVLSAAQPLDLLITGGTVVTLDAERRLLENGFVAIRGGRIVEVGEAAQLKAKGYVAKQTINARGKAVLPGLINTHTHLPMVLYRGLADDLNLQEWLTKYIFPAEAKNTTKEFVIWGTRLGLLELIRGGTTTYADMYYFEDAMAEETKRAGLRAVLGETLIDFPAPDNKTWAEAISYTETFVKRWHGDTLITPAFAPHAPYTVSTEHLNEVRVLADKYDAPILTHIAEAPTETEEIQQRYNARPVEYLERLNFLSPRVLGAHVVHVTEADLATLKSREVGIAHCPQSNMKLSSGTAPVPRMLELGLRLGLGTDGAASNNDLDLWEEMDTAAKLHKLVTRNPTVVSAREALELATLGGARALHQEREIGSLEAGKRADVILVGLDAPHQTPRYNLYSLLVYATKASDVTDTIVNGRVLMRNRRLLTLDEATIKARARAFQRRVSQSLNN